MIQIKATLKGYKFELKNIRPIHGHDDSLPFEADMYLNGTKIGTATNDGWGGEATYTTDNIDETTQNAFNSFCKTLSETTWAIITSDNGTRTESKFSLPFFIDCMAFQAVVLGNLIYDWGKF